MHGVPRPDGVRQVTGSAPAKAHTTTATKMFTIKYTDQDGLERLAQGRDIRVVKDGRQAKSLGWLDCVAGEGCKISFPTTAYVMNESGATVAKYVVVGEPARQTLIDISL